MPVREVGRPRASTTPVGTLPAVRDATVVENLLSTLDGAGFELVALPFRSWISRFVAAGA
jgi:hypothetical protein